MKFFEKYFPEKRRLRIFAWIYLSLFLVLFSYLFFRQVLERDDYLEKERLQGQRRIVRPGARGDVLDRENRLLIGNKAHYSATVHLEMLSREIWERKVELRRLSLQIREDLSRHSTFSFKDLVVYSRSFDHVQKRGINLEGKINKGHPKPTIWLNGERLGVELNKGTDWKSHLDENLIKNFKTLSVLNADRKIEVSVAGLFSLSFDLDDKGKILSKAEPLQEYNSWYDAWFSPEKISFLNFSTRGFSYTWEARHSVVSSYMEKINLLTGRNSTLTMADLKKHWQRKLVLPLELCGNLTNQEYALLIERLPPNSPIQVQAQAVRHYPERFLASHVLGYVGSGYESNPDTLSGSDLATFELQGRTGKAGVEKTFDPHLRGKDGGDIWIVNPMGSRFERVERQPSEKGEALTLSLDLDLQKIAESSIDRMVKQVSSQRRLPNQDWERTLERRTNRALAGTNETEVRAELLLSAFKDAPFPLTGKQASTVAGFKGTHSDAQRLLRHLYAQGVLKRGANNPDSFALSPPPPPPGAAVLLDLKTFEVLALASKPNYDLSSLTPYISQAAYNEIQRREAWLPRAWHPGYAPASPFKIVTALAGLQSSIIRPNEPLLCEGIYRGMKCHVHPGQHGEMDLQQAISQSCNVYFFRCAEKMGHHALINEARRVGMDQKPPLDLPSLRDSPIVPDPKWKKERIGVKWTMEDTFNISIGQGGLRQSPLQMACFIAKLAVNKLDFNPLVVKSNGTSKLSGEPLIDSLSRQEIIEGMIRATTEGTARRCRIDGITIAGKTGTGQWRNHNMKLNLAWFLGFAPAENPLVAISVLVEGVIPQDQVQGGLTAAPIARDILAAYFSKYHQGFTSTKSLP